MAEPVTTTTAASNSVSSLSQSTKEASKTSKTSAGKRDGPSTAKSSDKRMKSTNDDYDLDKEDKEADYVPITNDASSNLMEGKTLEQDPLILEKHRKAFYLKAFPPQDPDKEFEKSQAKSASIPQCRPQTEVDHIKYVVENWQVGTEICTMQDGPGKSALLHFRRTHPTGNKYIHQYTVEEIWAPGDPKPRTVLRRLEKNKDTQLLDPGRIVLSREEVFDGINEWHHFAGHMGQERTWGYCQEKYWNVTQQHVRYFCTTCFECMRKNPVPKKLRGSIKPIFSKNFRDRFQVDLIDFRKAEEEGSLWCINALGNDIEGSCHWIDLYLCPP